MNEENKYIRPSIHIGLGTCFAIMYSLLVSKSGSGLTPDNSIQSTSNFMTVLKWICLMVSSGLVGVGFFEIFSLRKPSKK